MPCADAGELVTEFRLLIFSIAGKLGRRYGADPGDLAAEGMIRLWRCADQVEAAGRPVPLIVTTVWRAMATALRRERKHRRTRADSEAVALVAVTGPAGPDHFAELVGLLDDLAERELIDARFRRGLTLAEVAESEGVDAWVIRNRSARALARLKAAIERGAR